MSLCCCYFINNAGNSPTQDALPAEALYTFKFAQLANGTSAAASLSTYTPKRLEQKSPLPQRSKVLI